MAVIGGSPHSKALTLCCRPEAGIAREEKSTIRLLLCCSERSCQLKGITGPQGVGAKESDRPRPHFPGRLHLDPRLRKKGQPSSGILRAPGIQMHLSDAPRYCRLNFRRGRMPHHHLAKLAQIRAPPPRSILLDEEGRDRRGVPKGHRPSLSSSKASVRAAFIEGSGTRSSAFRSSLEPGGRIRPLR